MATVTFTLVQERFASADLNGNRRTIIRYAEQAQAHGDDLCVFPAQALNGINNADLLRRRDYLTQLHQAQAQLPSIAPAMTVIAGTVHATARGLENAASITQDATQRYASQQQLEGAEWTSDRTYFTAGDASTVIDVHGVRIAVLWIDDLLNAAVMAQVQQAGAHMALVLAAERWQQGAESARRRLFGHCAKKYQLPIAWLNQVGGHDMYVLDGASCLVHADGETVAIAPRFDAASLRVQFDTETGHFTPIDWPQSRALGREGKLYRALVCGLRDFVAGTGVHDVLLGLSGGIDSALTLALAVDALGAEHVTAVLLPSRYTSELSVHGAEAQIKALGVAQRTLSIEAGFTQLLQTLQPHFDGKPVDTTEENMQARIRGLLLMALSNKHGQLLLVCSNKSETAVGYSTLYGDTCGAYAPLKDIYKTQVYALSRWRNAQGDGEIIPQAVIDRPPSAELREGQADGDSLPPYDELDAMLKAFIEKDRSRADLIAMGHAEETVERVLRLVLHNEFKRRQSAIGPVISRRGFDLNRDYPIVSAARSVLLTDMA